MDDAKLTLSISCVEFVRGILHEEGINWTDQDVLVHPLDEDNEDIGARISFPSSRFPHLTDFMRVAGRIMATAPDYCELRTDLIFNGGRIKTGAIAQYGQIQAYASLDAAGLSAEKSEKIRQAERLLAEVLRG